MFRKLSKELWTDGNKVRLLVSLILNSCDSLYPLLYAEWLRRVVTGIESHSLTWQLVAAAPFLLLLQLFLKASLEMFTTRFYNCLIKELREALFQKLTSVELDDIGNFTAGEIMTRYRQDIEGIASFYSVEFQEISGMGVSFVGAIGYFLSINPLFLPATIIPSFLYLLSQRRIRKKQFETQKDFAKSSDQIASFCEDISFGYSDIKQAISETFFMNKGKALYHKYVSIARESGKYENLTAYFAMLSYSLTVMLVIGCGIVFVYNGWCDIGAVMAAYSVFYMLANPIRVLSRYLARWQKGKVSIDRVAEFFLMKDERTEGLEQFDLSTLPLHVQLSEYHYPGAASFSLPKTTFNVLKGSYTAIVGRSGCGKSTLAKLIVGYSNSYTGEITCFATELRKASLPALRKHILYVSNDFWILDEPLIDFIQPEHDENQQLFYEVMEIVELLDFVKNQPLQERAPTGTNGDLLSGGQRQRLILARALTERADIYIFDEIFSAVDTIQAERIRNKIREFLPEVTILSVTHNVKEAQNADQVVYLDQGNLTLVDSPNHLFECNASYRQFCEEQQPEGELKDVSGSLAIYSQLTLSKSILHL